MGWLDPHLYLLDTQRRGDLPRRAVISNKSIEHVMLSRRPEMSLGIFVFCNCAMSCICLYALYTWWTPKVGEMARMHIAGGNQNDCTSSAVQGMSGPVKCLNWSRPTGSMYGGI